MSRVARGLGALTLLLLGLVGVPVALVVLGGNPLPSSVSWETLSRALLRPDDGRVLVGLITVVGWIAWAVFALSVLAELLALISGYRVELRLPGLAGPQRLASSLLIAVLALAPSLPSGSAQAEPVDVSPPGPPITAVQERPAAAPPPVQEVLAAASAAAHGDRDLGVTHVVEPGDDLWSLAERFYGDGRDWRKIARANPRVLTGGPDRLEPGWRLSVPGVVAERDDGTGSVRVRRGESLSSIAKRELGEASKWPALYDANRDQLDDPDELEIGVRLALPKEADENDKNADRSDERTDSRTEKESESADSAPPRRASPRVAERSPARPPVVAPTPRVVEPAPRAGSVPSAAPTRTQTAVPPPTLQSGQPSASPATDATTVVMGLTGVGALLAAALLGGLAGRRRAQLQARPLGRRIVHPSPSAQQAESMLGRRQQPMGLRTLDLALRAISAHCLTTQEPVPRLLVAAAAADELEFVFAEAPTQIPVGFLPDGRSWRLDQDGAHLLRSSGSPRDTLRPYPALVTVGADDRGRTVLVDLESLGMLSLHADRPADATAVLTAMALELAFSPWADEMILTLVGEWPDLPETLGKHNVSRTDDVDALLDRLERRAAEQRLHQPLGPRGHVRVNPDLADPWAPEVVLLPHAVTGDQQTRLRDLLTAVPRPTLAAVLGEPVPASPWRLRLPGAHQSAAGQTARLEPLGLDLVPQRLEPIEAGGVLELVQATTSAATTPAPWWVPEDDPGPPPDNVTDLSRRLGGWRAGADGEDVGTVAGRQGTGGDGGSHPPLLQLLGPVELLGAVGVLPPRASKQCLEYCGWLLEHPGTTAQAMAAALVVAEGTRRSNMSRLRSWLGSSANGEPYLPDAYSGRISLHPAVSSDWQQLQLLTSPGVNRASDQGLRMALELVRGAPLADAAPGQWHWAEELRTDMISAVRDIGVELADRALVAGDLDLARWAAARALAAAPGDELLLATRVRTEHQAGNAGETERLALQLAAQARALGVDLDPATVVLLQEVMEGRVRARMA